MAIIVKTLSEADFAAMSASWQRLLQSSDADPMFLSWPWQYSWWETWSRSLKLQLVLLAAYEEDELIGLAPLYLDTVHLSRWLKIRRLQFIGNAWRRADTVRTEYLGFVAQRGRLDDVVKAFAGYLIAQVPWDELIICDIPRVADSYRSIRRCFETRDFYVFDRSLDKGVRIPLVNSFESYLSSLGKNTRLKLYNRRTYFESLGDASIEYATSNQIAEYFNDLNRLHRVRWGKDCFAGKSLDFHKIFLTRLDQQALMFSRIKLNGDVVSTLYNVRMGNTEYNLQAGFLENVDKKISMGTLHLGYAIEKAFEEIPGGGFDLLAGSGKNTFYKQSLSPNTVEFSTLQIVKSRWLRWVYRGYFAAPPKLRKLLSKRWLF